MRALRLLNLEIGLMDCFSWDHCKEDCTFIKNESDKCNNPEGKKAK